MRDHRSEASTREPQDITDKMWHAAPRLVASAQVEKRRAARKRAKASRKANR